MTWNRHLTRVSFVVLGAVVAIIGTGVLELLISLDDRVISDRDGDIARSKAIAARMGFYYERSYAKFASAQVQLAAVDGRRASVHVVRSIHVLLGEALQDSCYSAQPVDETKAPGDTNTVTKFENLVTSSCNHLTAQFLRSIGADLDHSKSVQSAQLWDQLDRALEHNLHDVALSEGRRSRLTRDVATLGGLQRSADSNKQSLRAFQLLVAALAVLIGLAKDLVPDAPERFEKSASTG
jgi:hypothetical protein